ncbi:uncharacterized protein LOC125940870 [Dermacentor silvarum]|uniref:uncharacterized protein LOC125940870 n=1 Tax=Dermacentor silvarum TaxID=543639 RepID=UPI002101B2F3|nr:uncharacterized protein LOC125940870 [Dermacentor silvarum]
MSLTMILAIVFSTESGAEVTEGTIISMSLPPLNFPENKPPRVAQDDAHDAPGDAHDVPGDAQDVTGDAQDVTGDAHDVTGDAHGVTGDAHGVSGDAHGVTGDAHDVTHDDDDDNDDTGLYAGLTCVASERAATDTVDYVQLYQPCDNVIYSLGSTCGDVGSKAGLKAIAALGDDKTKYVGFDYDGSQDVTCYANIGRIDGWQNNGYAALSIVLADDFSDVADVAAKVQSQH